MTSKETWTGWIYIFPSSTEYPIEKVGYFPYPYLINTKISCQNENEFDQYPQKWIYLSSLIKTRYNKKKQKKM